MATYAAFKHVELHKVGYGKNRVPNAPRGCIGEIFGGDASGKSANGDAPVRPRDTHSRLFGTPNRASASARDAQRGTINLSEDRTDSHTPSNDNGNGNGNHHGHSSANGHAESQSNGHTAAALAKDGNPITGDGYKSLNGEINTVTTLNGNANPINHNRVPPGGYSSGLW